MKSSTAALAVLAAALVAGLCVSSAAADDKMNKYYKRTGEKFLAEKATEEGVFTLPSGRAASPQRSSSLTPYPAQLSMVVGVVAFVDGRGRFPP